MAKQYAYRRDEAEDMVQDILLAALREQRDFMEPDFLAWARGALRNHAAFLARSAARRKKREARFADANETAPPQALSFPQAFIKGLPASQRSLSLLINCGLNRKESAYLLGIGDAAFRQRLTSLRKSWKMYTDGGGSDPVFVTYQNRSNSAGLIRRSLRKAIGHSTGKSVGAHDPDGHLFIIFSEKAHK